MSVLHCPHASLGHGLYPAAEKSSGYRLGILLPIYSSMPSFSFPFWVVMHIVGYHRQLMLKFF